VVLGRIVLAALLLAGCKQSLFSNPGGGGGDDTPLDDANGSDADGMVQSSCGANCIADAAADFGTTKWQYFDDHRDRTWTAMTAMGGGSYVGANPANKLAASGGVLLVSTAGMTDPADPAIAYTAASNQVIKLSIVVDFPANAAEHTVRLYRNSREDSLFTGVGQSGGSVSTSITVDAFNGDRFTLAIAPTGAGSSDLPVKFFVNGTGMTFPQDCELGLQFSAVATNSITNLCGQGIGYYHDNGDNTASATPPALTTGPFAELGMAGSITFDNFFWGDVALDRSGDSTLQFWYQHRSFSSSGAVLYSDQNCDTAAGGGLAIYRYTTGNQLGIQTCTGISTTDYRDATYAYESQWHFIRIVHYQGKVNLCVDGTKLTTLPVAAGKLASPTLPHIGKNVDYSPVGAFVDAAMDDFRFLTTALPCD
jgi:hypothetical protein